MVLCIRIAQRFVGSPVAPQQGPLPRTVAARARLHRGAS
jgi:hypothetical protein